MLLRLFAFEVRNIMSLYDFFFTNILPFLSGFGVAAFIWNVYSYRQAQTGFLKLELECSTECTADEKYILSKTMLENTSRRPINIVHAFLLIVDQPISYKNGIRLVMECVFKKISDKTNKVIDESHVKEIPNDFKTMFLYLASNNDELEGDGFIIKLLPYYYHTHIRLGSFAHMATTHIQRSKSNGIYSVYFCVIGENWYTKRDPSQSLLKEQPE